MALIVVLGVILGAVSVALFVTWCLNSFKRYVYQVRARERLAGHDMAGQDLTGRSTARHNAVGHDIAGRTAAGYSAVGHNAANHNIAGANTAGQKSADQPLKSLLYMIFSDFCRNGVALLRPISKRLIRIPRVNTWCLHVSEALEAKVSTINPRSFLEFTLAASGVIAMLVFVLTTQPILALASMLLVPLFSIKRANTWHRVRRIRLREQLPDALNAIGMCFVAGHSLQQALGHVSSETPDPLGNQLRKTVNEIEVGYSVPEALERLQQRTDCADLRFVLVALEIHHMTGGSLRELLEGAATSISESFELMRSLEVQTAQARMSSRIVTIMPLALLVLLSLAMPGYLATFLSSTAGFMLLVVALGLEALGIFLIRRILGVDLE